jgi:Pyruvate/2-oxoacid:ferredoxin oxidoreductase delta subunit
MIWRLAVIAAATGLAAVLIFWLVGERGRILRPSTRQIVRESGLGSFFSLRGLHGYVYARWTKTYIRLLVHYLIHRFGPRAKKWLSDHYHGKVLSPEHARAILTLDRPIPLRDLEQIVPYPAARNLLLEGPPEVAAFECPCRTARRNPCRPTDVCMVVGQPFVDFVLEHHPRHARRLTQTEALELLEAEHRRGHVHAAWFKDICLDRFFAICNCCKCCCGGIDAMQNHGVPIMASSGYVAQCDEARCEACGECGLACPFGSIRVDGGAVVDWETCLGCGVCVDMCPQEAISLVRDERKGIPLDVRLLGEGRT